MSEDEFMPGVGMATGAAWTERGSTRDAPTRSNDRRRMINPEKFNRGRS
jgi:hypothetical protein